MVWADTFAALNVITECFCTWTFGRYASNGSKTHTFLPSVGQLATGLRRSRDSLLSCPPENVMSFPVSIFFPSGSTIVLPCHFDPTGKATICWDSPVPKVTHEVVEPVSVSSVLVSKLAAPGVVSYVNKSVAGLGEQPAVAAIAMMPAAAKTFVLIARINIEINALPRPHSSDNQQLVKTHSQQRYGAGMTPEEYTDLATAWNNAMTQCFPHRTAQLEHLWQVTQQHSPSPQRILEIGAGIGTVTTEAATRFPTAHVTGIDLDPVVTYVGQHTPTERVDVALGDVTTTTWAKTWPANSFDVIFSVASLHYVQPTDLPAVAQGAFQLLKPGGVFVNYDSMPHPGFTSPTPPLGDEPVNYPAWDNMWAYFRESALIPQELWDKYDDIFGPDWVEGEPSYHDFTKAWRNVGFSTAEPVTGPGKELVFVATRPS